MSLFETLMSRVSGVVPPMLEHSFTARTAVSYSGEFRRIEALPRRDWQERYKDHPGQAKMVHDALQLQGSTMELWPVQVGAIIDAVLMGGAFLPIGVGQGKALISLLVSTAMEVQRPVLFVPAQLREQTLHHVIPEMKSHWRLHPSLRVIGYSELSLAKNAKLLDEVNPDLIILDECHRVKNTRAGRTRRLTRWFREHPDTMCVAMSGTVSNRSIRDFAHIIQWCLKRWAPVPCKWGELADWADAIDEKVPDERRVAPGALMRFCQPGENARQGFRRRLVETPGVVATSEDKLGTSLIISKRHVETPIVIMRMVEHMRMRWETPNGDMITEAVELWRHVRELALGFWYRWDPPAPKEWLDARREWKSFVRETLKHNRRGLDTELQIWNECAQLDMKGTLDSGHPFKEWILIKDEFQPNVIAEWIDDFALMAAAEWLVDNPGICWTEHVVFGRKLMEKYGFIYLGAGDNRIIKTEEVSIIASIRAHSEGKNLQRWCRNLVVAPMSSGKAWEQLLGRTHRQGQDADEVTCDVFLHLVELEDSFRQARADARYLEDTFGNRQKLNYANILVDEKEVVNV